MSLSLPRAVRKLKPKDVVLIKAVSLQSIHDDGRLLKRLEVAEPKHDSIAFPRFLVDNPACFKPSVRPEDVS